MNDTISLKDAAKELGLNIKIVTSVRSFNNYNAFYNIFDDSEEACRRLVILTKDNNIEEVYDENPSEPVKEGINVDDNFWIREYKLTTNPNNIDINSININKSTFNDIKNSIK
ncbi:hypothetical protein [Clostridium sp. Ade.TY]|uniref:hypothetical protein n=1 Tax=Clostridium sp. Ade.TY TaxID=1391647 RepID=UPI000418BAFF|nr:hypothetical protein [Clostridium sp. Ade.TY]